MSREGTNEEESRDRSFESVTPPNEEAKVATVGETQSESFSSPRELRERLNRIRQGLDESGSQENPTHRASEELNTAQGHQARLQSDDSDSQSQDGQGADIEEQ